MNITTLSFSSTICEAYIIEDADNYEINGKAIVVNATEADLQVGSDNIKPWRSVVVADTHISGSRFILLREPNLFSSIATHKMSESIQTDWELAYDIFSVESLKETRLWRSVKDYSIENIQLNLWYATADTDCGIHNQHDFREVHTQIYGLGIMQKFNRDSFDSLYLEQYMAPGFTHEPFYDDEKRYPWHQYKSVSDCIWLAIEFYDCPTQ